MSLGQVMLFVSKIEKAKSFYIDLIGLEIVQDLAKEDGLIILKNDGCYLTIHEGFQPANIPYEMCRVVPIFRVPNIEEARVKLLNENIRLHLEITETPVHRYQIVQDFDGNWIEIAQFKK